MSYKILKLLKKYGVYIKDTYLDAWNYFKYSTLKIKIKNNENLSASILAHVHSVERAFSLKTPRNVFGIELVDNLKNLIVKIDDIQKYQYEIKIFKSAIAEYDKYHNNEISEYSSLLPYKNYIHKKSSVNSPFKDIVNNRHSIRDFGTIKIKNSDVLKAISIAKNISPSVCNRQGWEVVLIKNKILVDKVLKLQNGNSGIQNIQNILIVCSSLTSFFDSNERNQPYVDGGIFLMSILNSLHYKNIASCSLNWAVHKNQDNKLRKLIEIDNSRIIISLIGIGSYREEGIKIASSYRKPLKNILKIID